MREIKTSEITKAVARLCKEAGYVLGEDVIAALRKALEGEISPLGREVLKKLLENAHVARKDNIPLCQDCGTAVVFIELGQEVHITGGNLSDAVAEGVRKGYGEGYLRKSIVEEPFSKRRNTGDNTPPVIYTEIVPGEGLKLSLMAKGSGSENMSRLVMLKPADGKRGVLDFVRKTVEKAGGNACPPLVVGVGVGGTAERAMIKAKKALLRNVGKPGKDRETAELEREALEEINRLGIGPMGFGGKTTALAVHIESYPCHMASLPVAVNLQCHSARHKEVVL
jgi:fumarate hydratase subunit alpha